MPHDPRVSQDLVRVPTVRRRPLQQAVDDVAGLVREPRREGVLRLRHLLHELLRGSARHADEGRVAGEHLVEQHAQAPEVHGEAVALVQEDLGGHVVQRPTRGGPDGAPLLGQVGAPAKVGDLGAEAVAQEDVVRLQVAVDAALAVQVGDALQDLAVEPAGGRLGQPPGWVPPHQPQEAAVGGELQQHVDVGVVLQEVVEPEDVRVPHAALELHLPVHLLRHVANEERVLLHDLERQHGAGAAVVDPPHEGDGALAQEGSLGELEVVQAGRQPRGHRREAAGGVGARLREDAAGDRRVLRSLRRNRVRLRVRSRRGCPALVAVEQGPLLRLALAKQVVTSSSQAGDVGSRARRGCGGGTEGQMRGAAIGSGGL
mmetsp:Transcript_8919/g.26422  ORF Transcript_8919/g.26422 Transcript_8919/m.26422 type:complete len:373 (+) Transcript_8919:906-2024(+)